MEQRTFSVVICTYHRPVMLRQAVASALAQDYPADRYEVVVVDNADTEETAAVVRELARQSPVSLRYEIEPRNGLSYARNRGLAVARFDYVASLDDDAVAAPNWLAALNRTAVEHHALVVGGRVDPVPVAGGAFPAWLTERHLAGTYGLRYRVPEGEHVIEIHWPRYLSGCNNACLRQLLVRFGGYDPRLGRTAASMLAAEETYLHLRFERGGVPIFYADDAVVAHTIPVDRLTRRALLRRAGWTGVAYARMAALVGEGGWTALARAGLGLFDRRNLDTFWQVYRLVYAAAYSVTTIRLAATRAIPASVADDVWGAEDWLAEVLRWPDGAEKDGRLYALYRDLGDETNAGIVLSRLVTGLEATNQSEAAS